MKHIKLFEDWGSSVFAYSPELPNSKITWYLAEAAETPAQKAERLFKAMDGCGTDTAEIEKVFNSISGQAEWIQIIKAYGTREVSCWLTPNTTGDIFDCLDSEIDDVNLIKKLNNILKSKGCTPLLVNVDNTFDAEFVDNSLHFVGDLISAVADGFVPGSGAVIDAFHALVYFIQAYFAKDSMEKAKYCICAFIQIIAIALSGPAQAAAIGAKKGLQEILKFLGKKTLSRETYIRVLIWISEVEVGLRLILGILKDVSNLMIEWITGKAKFFAKEAIDWIASKIGAQSIATWLKQFFGTTVPQSLEFFLKELAKLNPTGVSAGSVTDEGIELIAKSLGKIKISNMVTDEMKKNIPQIKKTVSDVKKTLRDGFSVAGQIAL